MGNGCGKSSLSRFLRWSDAARSPGDGSLRCFTDENGLTGNTEDEECTICC